MAEAGKRRVAMLAASISGEAGEHGGWFAFGVV